MNTFNQKGFTLVESIIVLAIFSLIIPSVFSIITAITQQQADIYRLTEMKHQGDYALEYIKKSILKNAAKIYKYTNSTDTYEEVCSQNIYTDNFFETTENGKDFRMSFKTDPNSYLYFRTENGTLIKGDTSEGEAELTNAVIYIPYFHIECFQKNKNISPLIHIQFAVIYKNKSGQKVNINPLIYQTKFKLK